MGAKHRKHGTFWQWNNHLGMPLCVPVFLPGSSRCCRPCRPRAPSWRCCLETGLCCRLACNGSMQAAVSKSQESRVKSQEPRARVKGQESRARVTCQQGTAGSCNRIGPEPHQSIEGANESQCGDTLQGWLNRAVVYTVRRVTHRFVQMPGNCRIHPATRKPAFRHFSVGARSRYSSSPHTGCGLHTCAYRNGEGCVSVHGARIHSQCVSVQRPVKCTHNAPRCAPTTGERTPGDVGEAPSIYSSSHAHVARRVHTPMIGRSGARL